MLQTGRHLLTRIRSPEPQILKPNAKASTLSSIDQCSCLMLGLCEIAFCRFRCRDPRRSNSEKANIVEQVVRRA